MSGKVVLVIGQLHQGGAEGQLVRLALGLLGSPWVPVVACLSSVGEPYGPALRRAGVRVHLFPRRASRDPGRMWALAAFLRAERPALVHSFLVGANAYAYGACRLAGAGPLVVSSRTSMTMPRRALRHLHAWVFKKADAVIANSAAVRDFTAAYYGVRAAAIRVIPNGVGFDEEPVRPDEIEAFRRRAGAGREGLLVGTLGRLSREKNFALFVSMAAEIAARIPEARFAIVGDGAERRSLEESVRTLGLDDRVHFAGARSDVAAVLGAMDLFVLTSDTEGLPNAVMEAMAASLPVVATRAGGTAEVVAEGATGRLVPPGEIAPLVAAVEGLLRDAPLRRGMGKAGRERIEREFSARKMVEATRRLYDELAGARPR